MATMAIHPAAEVFPMLAEDELAELAADIKANGLIHPITIGDWIDDDGKKHNGIIDGRNRLRACEIAGVKPEFTQLNGQDPRAFIVSANLARRNLTKGQQAMALAMIYPDPEKGGRGHKKERVTQSATFSATRLRQARAVLANAPELVQLVLAGTKPLNDAYDEAQKRRAAAQSDEARVAELRAEAPDVAALVVEERITLKAGIEELAQRREKIRIARAAGRTAADKLLSIASDVVSIAGAIELGEKGLLGENGVLNRERLDQLNEAVKLLNRLFREKTR